MRNYNAHKFDFRSTPSTFIGYSTKFKGYKCLTSTGKVIYSRHVLFNETVFRYNLKCDTNSNSDTSSASSPVLMPSIPILSSKSFVPCMISSNSSQALVPPSIPSSSLPVCSISDHDHSAPVPTQRMVTRSQTSSLRPRVWLTIAKDFEPSNTRDALASPH